MNCGSFYPVATSSISFLLQQWMYINSSLPFFEFSFPIQNTIRVKRYYYSENHWPRIKTILSTVLDHIFVLLYDMVFLDQVAVVSVEFLPVVGSYPSVDLPVTVASDPLPIATPPSALTWRCSSDPSVHDCLRRRYWTWFLSVLSPLTLLFEPMI